MTQREIELWARIISPLIHAGVLPPEGSVECVLVRNLPARFDHDRHIWRL